MNEPTRLLIHGASGRMGRACLRLATADPGLRVVAAVIGRTPPPLDSPSIPVFGPGQVDRAPDFDVAVDFSLPEAFNGILAACVARRCAFVSGTTGLSETQRTALSEASRHIPIVWASNFSLGVAVLEDLSRRAAKVLSGWDLDIVEVHHALKKDAPSGTALTLGKAVAQSGGKEPRYASLRAGDIVGEHTVQFSGPGERVELIHRATNREIFARGALVAAGKLHGRGPGLYGIADLLLGD